MARKDPKCLRGKVCWLCEMPLRGAMEGECAGMWVNRPCWWVRTLAERGPQGALDESARRKAEREASRGQSFGAGAYSADSASRLSFG